MIALEYPHICFQDQLQLSAHNLADYWIAALEKD